MIYDKYGNVLSAIYDKNGQALTTAYDASGNVVFSDEDAVNLKIMSYNCGQWLTGGGTGTSTESQNAINHRNLLLSIMSAQNADVMCVQEYWGSIGGQTVPNILQPYFAYYREVKAYSSYSGHAVFSKYPINSFSTTNLGDNRYLDHFYIEVDGKKIDIFNCHLSTSSNEDLKVAEAETVFNTVRNYDSFILCGDFNTVCKSINDEEYTTIMKQFIDEGFNSANCSEQHGFIDTWTSGKTITGTWYPCDQIITSADIQMLRVSVDTTKLTDGLSENIDHLPIIARVYSLLESAE